MQLLNVDTLEQAREKLIQASDFLKLETEKIPLNEAEGRILSEDIIAGFSVPDFRRSTVDGYAVRAKDTQGAGDSIPCFLNIVGEVSIGAPAEGTVGPGECMYVPTGAMLPDGADAMVMVEHVELFDETQAAVYDAVSPGRNVIQIGEDALEGNVVLPKGRQIRPQETGVLASLGYTQVPVYRMPRITILSTGNELVSPGAPRKFGQIYDINTYGIEALCRKNHIRVLRTSSLKDEEELIRSAVEEAKKDSDIVVASGGSSQGKQDFTEKIFDECSGGGVFTHGLALKPGKPTILGCDKGSSTLLVGLPGHPAAAMMVFDLMVVWLMRHMMHVSEPKRWKAAMEINVAGGGGRTACQMVKLIEDKDSLYLAKPVLGKSGLISMLAQADGYVMIEAGKEGLKKGEIVEVIPM